MEMANSEKDHEIRALGVIFVIIIGIRITTVFAIITTPTRTPLSQSSEVKITTKRYHQYPIKVQPPHYTINNKFFHLIKHNEKLPQCQYKYEGTYPAEIKPGCDEEINRYGKFCIFHDKDHYAEHEQEATKRFEEKVLESLSQNKPLECFGYYLPDINFAELLKGKRSFPQRLL
jgi:hypothetical protein